MKTRSYLKTFWGFYYAAPAHPMSLSSTPSQLIFKNTSKVLFKSCWHWRWVSILSRNVWILIVFKSTHQKKCWNHNQWQHLCYVICLRQLKQRNTWSGVLCLRKKATSHSARRWRTWTMMEILTWSWAACHQFSGPRFCITSRRMEHSSLQTILLLISKTACNPPSTWDSSLLIGMAMAWLIWQRLQGPLCITSSKANAFLPPHRATVLRLATRRLANAFAPQVLAARNAVFAASTIHVKIPCAAAAPALELPQVRVQQPLPVEPRKVKSGILVSDILILCGQHCICNLKFTIWLIFIKALGAWFDIPGMRSSLYLVSFLRLHFRHLYPPWSLWGWRWCQTWTGSKKRHRLCTRLCYWGGPMQLLSALASLRSFPLNLWPQEELIDNI